MIEGEEEDPASVVQGSRQLALLPSLHTVHNMWYKRRWMWITRSTKEGGYYGRREDVLEVW